MRARTSPPEWHLALRAAPRLVDRNGACLDLPPLVGLLLAWLALEGPTPRARMTELLWPEKDVVAARNLLRQRLFRLRRHCGRDIVEGASVLALAPGIGHDLDEAPTLLDGLEMAPAPEAAQWLEYQRQRRRQRAVHVLAERAAMAAAGQAWPEAMALVREALVRDPLSEALHRQLIRLHYLAGDRAGALVAFDHCEQVLKDEVGTRPSAETMALLETLQQAPAERPPVPGLPVSVLRPPRMIGREVQRRTAQAALAAAQLAWISGDAGFGKTRLLQELMAGRPGALQVSARPGDVERPYAVLQRLVRALLAAHPALQSRPEVAAAADLFEPGHAQAPLDEAALERTLRRLLQGAAAAGVTTLALDDLHFADAATLEMLFALTSEIDPALPAWVVAARPAGDGNAAARLRRQLEDRLRIGGVELLPLSIAETQALLDSLAVPGLDADGLAPRLHRHCGGNPLFMLEALRTMLLRPEGLAGERLPALAGVLQLVGLRLARCSPAALRLARCAAIAGQDFSIALATRILGIEPLDLTDAWGELERAHLLSDQGFAHDLVHDAALASVPAPLAREMHGRVAAFLREAGAPPERQAAHWQSSDTPVAAVAPLLEAGARALSAFRRREAREAFEQAATLLVADGRPDEAFDALEQWFVKAEPRRDADTLRLLDRLHSLARTRERQAVAVSLRCAVLEREGEWLACGELAVRALAEVDAGTQPLLAAVLTQFVAVSETFAGRSDHALNSMFRALALCERAGDERRLSEMVGTLGNLLMWQGRLEEAYQHQLRSLNLHEAAGRSNGTLAALLGCIGNRLEVGRVREAKAHLSQADHLALRLDLDLSENWPVFNGHRARLALDEGRFREALVLLDASRQLPSQAISAQNQITKLWMRLGQWNRARQSARTALSLCSGALPVYAARALELAAEADAGTEGGAAMPAVYDEIRQRFGQATKRIDLALRIASARHVAGSAGWAGMVALRDEAARSGHGALQLLAEVRACEAAAAAGLVMEAAAHAESALALFAQFEPYGLYRAEVWKVAAQVMALVDPERSRQIARSALEWVEHVAANHVDAPFRESFRYRNPVNRALTALAASPRLAAR